MCFPRCVASLPAQNHHFGQSRYYAPLLHHRWKETAKRETETPSSPGAARSPDPTAGDPPPFPKHQTPVVVVVVLFQYDIVVLHILRNAAVIAQTRPCAEAPAAAAERLLGRVEDHAADTDHPMLRAWARSGSLEAPPRMERLVQRVRQRGIPRTVISYRSFLVGCARRQQQQQQQQQLQQQYRRGGEAAAASASTTTTAARMIRDTLRTMQAEGLEPNLVECQHAVD